MVSSPAPALAATAVRPPVRFLGLPPARVRAGGEQADQKSMLKSFAVPCGFEGGFPKAFPPSAMLAKRPARLTQLRRSRAGDSLCFGYDPCCTFTVLDKAHVMVTMSRAVEADDL